MRALERRRRPVAGRPGLPFDRAKGVLTGGSRLQRLPVDLDERHPRSEGDDRRSRARRATFCVVPENRRAPGSTRRRIELGFKGSIWASIGAQWHRAESPGIGGDEFDLADLVWRRQGVAAEEIEHRRPVHAIRARLVGLVPPVAGVLLLVIDESPCGTRPGPRPSAGLGRPERFRPCPRGGYRRRDSGYFGRGRACPPGESGRAVIFSTSVEPSSF